MTWLKLDDKFTRHRKIAPLSDAAFRLHVTALVHCAEYETDGKLTRDDLQSMAGIPRGKRLETLISDLVDRGLWDMADCGVWWMHDFLKWNKSHEELEAKRQARAEAGARGGRSSGETRRQASAKQSQEQSGSKNEANASANGQQHGSHRVNPVACRRACSLSDPPIGSFPPKLPDPDQDLPDRLGSAREGEPVPASERRPKPRRWRFCPESWEPNAKHVARALELGLDLAEQVTKFRNHEYKDPKSDADRAFTNWLLNSRDKRGVGRPLNRAEQITADLFAEAQKLEAQESRQ